MDSEPETLRDIWKRYRKVVLVRNRVGEVHIILGISPTGWFVGYKVGAKHTTEYEPDTRTWTLAGDI